MEMDNVTRGWLADAKRWQGNAALYFEIAQRPHKTVAELIASQNAAAVAYYNARIYLFSALGDV